MFRLTDQADAGRRRIAARAWNALMVAGIRTGSSASIIVRIAVNTVHSLSPQKRISLCAIDADSAFEFEFDRSMSCSWETLRSADRRSYVANRPTFAPLEQNPCPQQPKPAEY
jgi:hypothetical protein